MDKKKSVSLADNVFERLEGDILSGKYKMGELLTEISLSKQLAVSRTPVREAIRKLEQENLVRETPKGHIVTGISQNDIYDIYDIRLKIEGTATAKCAKIISDDILSQLAEIVELQGFYTEKGEADKIKGTDSAFHELIYRNCGSEVYSTLLSTLHRKIQLCRKLSLQNMDRAKQSIVEHREIYCALKEHNEKLAEALAIQHINNAKISIMRFN